MVCAPLGGVQRTCTIRCSEPYGPARRRVPAGGAGLADSKEQPWDWAFAACRNASAAGFCTTWETPHTSCWRQRSSPSISRPSPNLGRPPWWPGATRPRWPRWLLALLMPFLGSLADLKGNKKKFLAGTIGTGAVSLRGHWARPATAMVFLAIYVVLVGHAQRRRWCSTTRSWSTPPTQDRYDEVSSQGYAWGYIGSCIPFIVCLVIVLFGSSFGIGHA